VYVHGSGANKNMTLFCEMVEYFVSAGYVFFVPYLRGYNDSTTKCETGVGFNPWLTEESIDNTGVYIENDARGVESVMRMEIKNELQFAFDYLTQLESTDGKPLVVPSKIALAGHSFGGITVSMAASASLKPQPAAIVAMSAAVLSWPNDPERWHGVLCPPATDRKMPMFMFQTLNESSDFFDGKLQAATHSTLEPFICAQKQANRAGNRGAEMAVFSAVRDVDPQGPYCKDLDPEKPWLCAHTTFVMQHEQVARWAPQMRDFLAFYGVK
jgi:pimeloyl-ACP methyl ester carboxylesterase